MGIQLLLTNGKKRLIFTAQKRTPKVTGIMLTVPEPGCPKVLLGEFAQR